jgi:peptidoglycan/xylan/chitin deacetylase (PgdA/CDA1 family)
MLVRIALALLLVAAPYIAGARELALTFDDAPTADSAIMSGDQRTTQLIDNLRQARVPQVAIFAVPQNRAANDLKRLSHYAQNGHVIANHSNTHPNLNAASAQDYLQDIQVAHERLSGYATFQPWFRYPFLAEGRDVEKRDEVRSGLKRMGYRNGYVTIDNYDWYIANLANRAVREGKRINRTGLKQMYIEHVVGAADFYDKVAQRYLGRSPRHTLLLHENDLAALYIADLVTGLRNAGWKVIAPHEAYSDPISSEEPDTLFLNQGRVAAIAHTLGAKPADLFFPGEEEAVLDADFRRLVLEN